MSPPESDHMKKLFARQRAKDLADHAKAMLAKDREIEELRKKCQELADTLSNADFLGPEVRRGICKMGFIVTELGPLKVYMNSISQYKKDQN